MNNPHVNALIEQFDRLGNAVDALWNESEMGEMCHDAPADFCSCNPMAINFLLEEDAIFEERDMVAEVLWDLGGHIETDGEWIPSLHKASWSF